MWLVLLVLRRGKGCRRLSDRGRRRWPGRPSRSSPRAAARSGSLGLPRGPRRRDRVRERRAFARKTLAHSTIKQVRRGQGLLQQQRSRRFRSVFLDHPFQRDAGIDNDRHAESRPRSRRRSSRVEGPSSPPMMRRISASRRAAASCSRPTAFVRARRACSPIEVPQAAARRRNASITVASKFRIMIWPNPLNTGRWRLSRPKNCPFHTACSDQLAASGRTRVEEGADRRSALTMSGNPGGQRTGRIFLL